MTEERKLAIKCESARDRFIRRASWERTVRDRGMNPLRVMAAGGHYPAESESLVQRAIWAEKQQRRRELDRRLAEEWLNMRGL